MRPLPRLLRYAPKAREGTLKLHFYLESIVGIPSRYSKKKAHIFTALKKKHYLCFAKNNS